MLRVSSELAAWDAIDAVDRALTHTDTRGIRTVTGARRAAHGSRICSCCGTRFPLRAFDRHAAPWLGGLVERIGPYGGRVRGR